MQALPPADYTVRFRSFSTSFLQDDTGSAGGNSTPLSATVDFGVRGNGASTTSNCGTSPCGMSYAINCDDADGDGVCNYFDLCANHTLWRRREQQRLLLLASDR
ncbi:MAG: hypothetical protein IPP33_15855 [Flavobacteriales bacterium]|nr:hypothetical protein [Flavobacteriales bacterium]